ncbi:MAG: hypothetical protein AVDCRST_MAG34-1102 [uncultured Nocardioidaceae bacterium]|uniref:ANTAR domain-containing protein n=1 Tax=uncultured Nocardioidaceae bacterium TaxID=253824 RepID=A0A6J4LWQ8_9ACTN|nr:MAG: hypothetical protein AVDCRST_MAG34-1102 [uncultured Nocardioidaceae bacterium]
MAVEDVRRALQVAEELSRRLVPGDLDQTLARITSAAVEVLPEVDYASITVKHADGRLDTFAQTDDLLLGLDAAQYDLREGPCFEAAVEATHRVSPDLATDDRFPGYAPLAVAAGIRAQAGIRLFDTPKKAQGAINLYSARAGSFTDITSLTALFAHQAAVAVRYAHEVDDLRQAIATRRVIGQAVGIVMERYEMTDARAFAFLSRLSQERNVKLRLVAQELVAASESRNEEDKPDWD